MWGRLATVLVAVTAGAVLTWLGWPPRLGIDLKGGVILVYEVDASRQAAGQVDDCVGRIEQLLASQDGRKGTVSRMADNRIAVRLETADAAARESFLKGVEQVDFGDARVRLAGQRAGAEAIDLENFLNEWINNYVTPDDQASAEVRARLPLRAANVEVREEPGTAGNYRVIMRLQPHFQLDQIDATLKLVTMLHRAEQR
jgi:preprotein translocase subunit SecD